VANGRQAVFEVDAWGQHLAGFQNVSGKTIQDNNTRQENISLTNGRRYTITVQVRRNSVAGLLDDKEICRLETDGTELSMHDVWRLPNPDQLGLVTWNGDTEFHSVEIRHLGTTASQAGKDASTRNEIFCAGRKEIDNTGSGQKCLDCDRQ
jgi:hypothetical protein